MSEPWRFAREARAAPELAAFVATAGPLVAVAPRGDGHPVLVLPGLGGGDGSTRPLRWFLAGLGYQAYGWGQGTNTGPSRRTSAELDALLARLVSLSGQLVSIVGWSLGGVFACGLAARSPQRVRQVITLGSPLRMAPNVPANVPVTSVYSRTDAIVPWRASLLDAGPERQNIEVRGSHLGLGHNPPVLVVVADRLALPIGRWRPFRSPRWAGRWLPPERTTA
jgi:pimeloyl-ACP methyl ester carboxylesterase